MSSKEIERFIEETLEEHEEVLELTQIVNPELDQAIEFEEDTMALALRDVRMAKTKLAKEMHKRVYQHASKRKQELLMSYRKVG